MFTQDTISYHISLHVSVMLQFYRLFGIMLDTWQQSVRVGELLFIGYLVHYVPYLLMQRTIFLYHYLPAFMFSLLLLAANIELTDNIMQLQ